MLAAGASPSHRINSMVASSVWWLVSTYSGPIQSWLSRIFYSFYCNWLIGGATGIWGNVKWFFVCMKSQEDIGNYAYSNSQQALGLLSAGGAYWLSHQFQRFWYRASSIASAGARVVENELTRRLHSIHGRLEQLAVQQSAERSKESVESDPTLLLQLRETQARLRDTESTLKQLQTDLLQQWEEDQREFSETISAAKQKFASTNNGV